MWKLLRSVPHPPVGALWLLGATAISSGLSCGSSEAASFEPLQLPSGETSTQSESLRVNDSASTPEQLGDGDAGPNFSVVENEAMPSEMGERSEGTEDSEIQISEPASPRIEEEGADDLSVVEPEADTPDGPVEPQPVLPAVVSVEPAADSTGVRSTDLIVIRFNKAMDQEATEAAYQSETIPSSSVEFSWNEESTALTIRPLESMQYATGADPAEVPARRMNFFLSGSAQDAEGTRMASAFESGFSLLREIRGQLQAVQDRDLSGNYRSNDTYGGGQCARDETTICFGDSGTGDEVSYRGFVTFDLSGVPQGLDGLEVAELAFDIADLEGQPFSLGGLRVEQAEFDEINLGAFTSDALAEVALIEDPASRNGQFSIDVSSVFAGQVGQRLQFRFAFEVVNDLEEDFDAVVTSWDSHTLRYSFLIP